MVLESSNLKIILTFLIEVIVLYVQITIVNIGVLRFERFVKFVPSFVSWGLVLNLLNINPH